MRFLLTLALAFGAMTTMATADDHECALNFKAKNIDGKTVDLEDYEGKVVLVVNTASKCGLTSQYAGLEKLYSKHKEDGLVILGFPCNQFAGQEPGSDADIKKFCSSNYKVTFPMFSKIDVNGDDAAPIYKYLTSKDVKPAGTGNVRWNFEKFLIDREGNLVNRFSPQTSPDDSELVKQIKTQLKNK